MLYSHDLWTTIVLVTIRTAAGVFGAWLGTNRFNWFWCGLMAFAAIAMLLPPRAYAPALGLALNQAKPPCAIRA